MFVRMSGYDTADKTVKSLGAEMDWYKLESGAECYSVYTIMDKSSAPFSLVNDNLKRYFDQRKNLFSNEPVTRLDVH